MFWIWPRGHVADLEGIPCWAADRPDVPGLLYGFPALTQGVAHLGNKVAHHAPGAVVDPDAELDAASAGELASILASAAPFLPAIQGTMTGAQVCKYTMSADGHFVVDAHPGHANMVFGCGFSGHGFKFAPAIGRALADLALEGRTPLPIGFLAMRPFPSAG
jgi:sarcosine oxidase